MRRVERVYGRAALVGWLLFATTGCASPEVRDAGPNACRASSECDDGVFCNGLERCDPFAPGANARGCVTAFACTGGLYCDEALDTCVRACPDRDGDGHRDVACGGAGNDDCDDTDPNRFPGNPEVCVGGRDAHDEDCNVCTVSSETTGDGDPDRDGFVSATCGNTFVGSAPPCSPALTRVVLNAVTGRDCDGNNPQVHPGATELCNGVDDNCDGMSDTCMSTPDE